MGTRNDGLTVTARISVPVDPGAIRQVIPIDDRECQIVYVDPEGRYVGGTVACSASALAALLGLTPEALP